MFSNLQCEVLRRRSSSSRCFMNSLNNNEIVSILEESQIATVSQVDLLHPKHNFIVNFYTRILFYIDSWKIIGKSISRNQKSLRTILNFCLYRMQRFLANYLSVSTRTC